MYTIFDDMQNLIGRLFRRGKKSAAPVPAHLAPDKDGRAGPAPSGRASEPSRPAHWPAAGSANGHDERHNGHDGQPQVPAHASGSSRSSSHER